jgi:hypothetical protein
MLSLEVSQQTFVAGVLLKTPIVKTRGAVSIALKARSGLQGSPNVFCQPHARRFHAARRRGKNRRFLLHVLYL